MLPYGGRNTVSISGMQCLCPGEDRGVGLGERRAYRKTKGVGGGGKEHYRVAGLKRKLLEKAVNYSCWYLRQLKRICIMLKECPQYPQHF